VDVGPAVVADEQAAALVEPGEAALDDPAFAPQAGAVLGEAARDQRFDPAFTDEPPVLVVVVAAVAQEHGGPASGPARAAADGRHPVEQGRQHEGVVSVRARQQPGQRHAGGVGQEVVLAARAAPVDRARADLLAPFFA
jgi:hypothetical protein